MNKKHQKIANRHLTDQAHLDAYAIAVVQKVEYRKRIAASRLILNGLLETDDVFLLNDQLAKKTRDIEAQIGILEKWFDWVDAVGKYQAAKNTGHGYAVDWLRYDALLYDVKAAREEVESI